MSQVFETGTRTRFPGAQSPRPRRPPRSRGRGDHAPVSGAPATVRRVSDVPHVLRHRLVTGGGVHYACCSARCLTALRSVQPAGLHLEDGVAALWPFGTCAHCAWCGELVCVPASECRVHNRPCPEFRWEFTASGLGAMREVRRRSGVGDFTPRALAAFTEVALHLRTAGRYPDIAGLVDGVLDRRVDWLP